MANQYTNKQVPYEKSIEYALPHLKEEFSSKNTKKMSEIYAGSGETLVWDCSEGHEWTASPNHRKQNIKCRVCSNKQFLKGVNDLKTLYPKLAEEFDELKNGDTAENTLGKISKKYHWKCKYGHEWITTLNHRHNSGSGCPTCSGYKVLAGFNDLQTKFPDIAKEWNYKRNKSRPSEYTAKSRSIVWWKCVNGHEWKTRVASRTQGRGCKDCSNKGTSEPERIMYKIICNANYIAFKNQYIEANVQYTKRRKIECDIVLPKEKIIIEYDGYFWHTDIDKDIDKTIGLIDNGWYVIRFRDNKLPSLSLLNERYTEVFITPYKLQDSKSVDLILKTIECVIQKKQNGAEE